MVYAIWAGIGLLAFIFKKNRFVTALVFAFIAAVMCFNTANPDLANYTRYYNNASLRLFEPLYALCSKLFLQAGASFLVFRGVLSVAALLLIVIAFYRLTPYPTVALFMYTIYPMTIDCVQFRFRIAYSIVFFGVWYLIKYQEMRSARDLGIFIFTIVLATGFHYSAALYIVLALMTLDIDRHRILYYVVIPLTVIIGVAMISRFAPLIGSIIGDNKASLWAESEKVTSVLRKARMLCSRALPLLYSILLSYVVKDNQTDVQEIQGSGTKRGLMNSHSVNHSLFVCMYYIFLFVVLEITIAGDYERLARLGLLIGTVLITRQISELEESSRVIALVGFLIMYLAYFALIMFVMKNKLGEHYITLVFRQVMENNSLLCR